MPDTTTRATEIRAELDASQLRESKLAARIDQLIGWAKSGQRPEGVRHPDYYVMRAENVDGLRNDIIDVIVAELSDPESPSSGDRCKYCRQPIVQCGRKVPHAGCASSLGWVHDNGGGHACEARSDGPYATPAGVQS